MNKLQEQKLRRKVRQIINEESAEKHYITLNKPNDVSSKRVKSELEDLIIQNGVRSKNIGLKLSFVVTPDVSGKIMNKFRVMKNKVAFQRDTQ